MGNAEGEGNGGGEAERFTGAIGFVFLEVPPTVNTVEVIETKSRIASDDNTDAALSNMLARNSMAART